MKDKLILTSVEFIPDVNGKKKKTTISVWYNKNADAFYTKSPAHLCEHDTGYSQEQIGNGSITERVQDGFIWADRPQKVLEKLNSQIHLYFLAIQKKRKIIAYKMIYDEDNPFEKGIGFHLEWYVGWELKVGNRTELFAHEPSSDPKIHVCNQRFLFGGMNDEKIKTIDWSENREKFFLELEKAIQELKEKCRKFLGNENKLILTIDTGNLLIDWVEK